MIALLALLLLLAGPPMFTVPAFRLRRRAAEAGVHGPEAMRELVTPDEAAAVVAGGLAFAVGVLILAVLAVLG